MGEPGSPTFWAVVVVVALFILLAWRQSKKDDSWSKLRKEECDRHSRIPLKYDMTMAEVREAWGEPHGTATEIVGAIEVQNTDRWTWRYAGFIGHGRDTVEFRNGRLREWSVTR